MSKIYLLVSLLVSVLLLSSCGMTSNSSIVKSYKDGEIKQSEYYEQMYVNTLKSSSSSTKLDWLEYYEVFASSFSSILTLNLSGFGKRFFKIRTRGNAFNRISLNKKKC